MLILNILKVSFVHTFVKQAGAELSQDYIKLEELFTLIFFLLFVSFISASTYSHCFHSSLNHNSTPMGWEGGG